MNQKSPQSNECRLFVNSPNWTRTSDTLINSQVLWRVDWITTKFISVYNQVPEYYLGLLFTKFTFSF